jgi:hypothetical protein
MVITGGTVNQETLADLRDLNASLRFKPLALSQLVEETRALVAARDISQTLDMKERIRSAAGPA